jgi:hypothetical protein
MKKIVGASVLVMAMASGAQAACWEAWSKQSQYGQGCYPSFEACMSAAAWVVKCTKR